MDLVTEAMSSLATKMEKLHKEEYSLQDGIRKQVMSLLRELRSMHTDQHGERGVPPDQVDARLITWAPVVKEASHDMECVIDAFLTPLVEHPEPADPDRLQHLLENMGSLLETGKAFYSKSSVNDGIDEPSDELIKMLSVVDHDEAYNGKMKILSIVRSEVLGKSTVAQKIFDKLIPQFDCGAFVLVGQNPDLRKVFTEILIGLDKQKYESYPLTILDLMDLIGLVRKSLINKRYVTSTRYHCLLLPLFWLYIGFQSTEARMCFYMDLYIVLLFLLDKCIIYNLQNFYKNTSSYYCGFVAPMGLHVNSHSSHMLGKKKIS